MTTNLQNEYYIISYDQTKKCSYLNFLQKTNESILKKAYPELIHFFKQKDIITHITNTSLMGVISVESQEWVSLEIVPQLIDLSLKGHLNLGLIIGEDIFSTFGARSMAQKAARMGGDDLMIKFFSKESLALEWLEDDSVF